MWDFQRINIESDGGERFRQTNHRTGLYDDDEHMIILWSRKDVYYVKREYSELGMESKVSVDMIREGLKIVGLSKDEDMENL